MTTQWYQANTGNHQGLIIDENTGYNIAVSYDKNNAQLIAAAPELLSALKVIADMTMDCTNNDTRKALLPKIKMIAWSAIGKATL